MRLRPSIIDIVCNFLSSSTGFNLCSCFFRLTFVFLLALPDLFRLSIPRLFTVSFPLSDPLLFQSSFEYFSFGFRLLSLCFSFPSLPGSASQLLPQCPSPLSIPRFPLSLRPNFSCLPSRFLYLALLFVSFRSSLLRSHSCSTGAYLPFSLLVFSTSCSFPFVHSLSASSYSAFCSSFPFLHGSALQLLSRCPVSALASSVSPFSPT